MILSTHSGNSLPRAPYSFCPTVNDIFHFLWFVECSHSCYRLPFWFFSRALLSSSWNRLFDSNFRRSYMTKKLNSSSLNVNNFLKKKTFPFWKKKSFYCKGDQFFSKIKIYFDFINFLFVENKISEFELVKITILVTDFLLIDKVWNIWIIRFQYEFFFELQVLTL